MSTRVCSRLLMRETRWGQAPVHEIANGLVAAQAGFLDIAHTLAHQREVGAAGREARVVGGVLALDLGGQARELVEQLRLAGGTGAADGR